ncbi:MAG: nucleoside-diphosphate kinase [Patescibacteria group bacterium]
MSTVPLLEPTRERTLVIMKPDTVRRALTGEILARFERVGLKIVGAKMVWMTQEFAKKHYVADRVEWVKGLGEKSLMAYTKNGTDPKETFGTADPYEIGKVVAGYLIDYVCSGPVIAFLLEGNMAIEIARKLAGPTLPIMAAPGTIRGDYSNDSTDVANSRCRGLFTLVHASGNKEEAAYEVKLWFKDEEIFDYTRADEALRLGKF